MFATQIERSSVVSLISEETSEDEASHKVLLRVADMRRWGKIVVSLLKAPEESGDEPSFGVSIRKEYYLDESGSPTFCWVLLFWGDLEDAAEVCGPLLSKSFAPPPPPAGAVAAAPSASRMVASPIQKRTVMYEDGTERELTVVPLGGHAAERNAKGRSRRRAFVEATDFSKGDAPAGGL